MVREIVVFTINALFAVGAFIFLGLSGWFCLEAIAALFPIRSRLNLTSRLQSVAVLVPAHNEEVCLPETLATLQAELKLLEHPARLVVVADNCTDSTAMIAQNQGAIVVERHDLTQVGKGYAIDYGLRYLEADAPDIVVLVDADCLVKAGAIANLIDCVSTSGRPAQSTYLMTKPSEPSAKDAVSVFAFTVKNLVRPLGLLRFGLPCLLTGTGMAFPWAVLRSVDLASGHLVEDMKLSLDLTIGGCAPIYCPEARVTGQLPQHDRAARSQRTRWEHGHLQSILTDVPALIKTAIQKRRPEALALALELAVPPMALFVMLWLVLWTVSLGWGLISGNWSAAILATAAGLCLIVAVVSAWVKFGQADLSLNQLLSIPFYILWKIPMYLQFLVRPQQAWVRTERDASPE